MVYVTQLVYLIPGQEAVFEQFEALAIPRLALYGGKLLMRIRTTPETMIESSVDRPDEMHWISFPSVDALHCFMSDPLRKEHEPLKTQSIALAKTTIADDGAEARTTNADRLALARKALLGTAIGDAFGESFFGETDAILQHIAERNMPASSWEFTDDTVMALAVFEELEVDGKINQDRLAQKFARNYALDMRRGYGGTAHKILREIGEGQPWREASEAVFDGMGSMGNGAAMRVAPIGAYFFDAVKLEAVAKQAADAAAVTHANLEARAGAEAIACATTLATRMGVWGARYTPEEFILMVAEETYDSDLQSKLRVAATLPAHTHIETLKTVLGNGSKMTAQDTVPFAIWCAAHHLDNFEEALWHAVSALGDRDTICAMVGGIVTMSCDPETVPAGWRERVEDVEGSVFRTR